jgi:hypothetical protein
MDFFLDCFSLDALDVKRTSSSGPAGASPGASGLASISPNSLEFIEITGGGGKFGGVVSWPHVGHERRSVGSPWESQVVWEQYLDTERRLLLEKTR